MMEQTTEDMRIGELAEAVRLNPKTIRYYEEIGLLPQARRGANGYRWYTHHDVEQLRFVLKAKTIGFKLEEIREIVRLQRGGEQPCDHVETLIKNKLAAVDGQLRALTDVRQQLAALRAVAKRTKNRRGCICGIIETHTPPQHK
jgi:DNA-binding transcriptional MerR regulator